MSLNGGRRVSTDANEVIDLFRNSRQAKDSLERWKADSSRAAVRDVVLNHVAQHVYQVTVDDIGRLKLRIGADSRERYVPGGGPYDLLSTESLHPLTKIDYEKIRYSLQARDWNPPLAFNHAFHYLLESREGRLFTFPEFLQACDSDTRVLGPLLAADERRVVEHAERSDERTLELIRQAIRWRLGCAYYAFLKELWLLAWGTHWGMPLRVHPLADTLFRTDLWDVDKNLAIALYLGNSYYQDKLDDDVARSVGRKIPTREFVRGAFRQLLIVRIETPHEFGTVVLPDATLLKQEGTAC